MQPQAVAPGQLAVPTEPEQSEHGGAGSLLPHTLPVAPTFLKTEVGQTSAGSMPNQSDSNGPMIQMMQQLMHTVASLNEEVQNLKEERPHKKEGKAVSEATSGSFEVMHQ